MIRDLLKKKERKLNKQNIQMCVAHSDTSGIKLPHPIKCIDVYMLT